MVHLHSSSFFQEVDLQMQDLPAKCMCMVQVETNNLGVTQNELWIGSVDTIIIFHPDALYIMEKVRPPYFKKAWIFSLITNNIYVWSAHRNSNNILQWSAKDRKVLCYFKCYSNIIVGQNIKIEHIDQTRETQEVSVIEPNNIELNETPQKEVENVKEPSVNEDGEFLGRRRSISLENIDLSVDSSPGGLPRSTSMFSSSDRSRSRTAVSESDANSPTTKSNGQFKEQSNENSLEASLGVSVVKTLLTTHRPSLKRVVIENRDVGNLVSAAESIPEQTELHTRARPRTSAFHGVNDKVTSLYLHKGDLWIGKLSGDILVLDIDESPGLLKAILNRSLKKQDRNKTIQVISQLNFSDQIIASVRVEEKAQLPRRFDHRKYYASKRVCFQLLVLNLWNAECLETFRQRHVKPRTFSYGHNGEK